ncbi:MAG: hypothetical protein ACT4O2_10360 [Beijerinckiaceae bacterium]
MRQPPPSTSLTCSGRNSSASISMPFRRSRTSMSRGDTMTLSTKPHNALLLGREDLFPNRIQPGHSDRDLRFVQGRVELDGPDDHVSHHPRRSQDAAQLLKRRRLELGGREAC